MPSLTNLLIVSVVAFAAPFVLGLFPGVRLPSVVLEIVAGIVVGPSVLGLVEADQAGRGDRADRAHVRALPRRAGDRLRTAARAGPAPDAARVRAVVRRRRRSSSLGLERGGPRRHAAAGRDHPLRDVARRARPGAQGRRRDRLDVRPAHHRGRVDRRLRRDHPADDLLLRRGRHRLDAAAARLAVRAGRRRLRRRPRRRALGAHPRRPPAPAGHDRADPRPRRARAVRRLRGDRRSSSGSRRSSARSSPARSSRSSTPTR